MRKNIFVALVAVCLAVPGMAKVSSISVVDPIAIGSECYQMDNPEIDPQLAYDILRAAAEQCEYDYATLQGWYDDGTVAIEKYGNVYRVLQPGGAILAEIEDML
jgi:hypothetical protein